jgi:magnesium-transporting ATPase (P-type)
VILFQEKQRFTQWWLWLLLIGLILLPLVGIYQQIWKGEPFGTNPMSDNGLYIFLLMMLLLNLLFYSLSLTTTITKEGIRMKFFPFVPEKFFSWSMVKSAEVIDYGFVGGWGIRLGSSYGTVYNTRGSKGIFITLQQGKKLCIGTQKEEELKKVLRQVFLTE